MQYQYNDFKSCLQSKISEGILKNRTIIRESNTEENLKVISKGKIIRFKPPSNRSLTFWKKILYSRKCGMNKSHEVEHVNKIYIKKITWDLK